MYSAYSRMEVQRTWEAITNAPVGLDEVVFAEWVWAATKSTISVTALLAVILAIGYGRTPLAVWVIPLAFLLGLCFGAWGLIMTALAYGYEFFTYFFTLVLTPTLLLSGVYFPVERLPEGLQLLARVLPLSHAIDLARPLLTGRVPPAAALHLAVILAYAAAGFYAALVLTRRRLAN
jgi:lipooligosaccharide transport system permease protein